MTTPQGSTPAQKAAFPKGLLIALFVGVSVTLLLRLTPMAAGPRLAIGFFTYVIVQAGLIRMWTSRRPGWPATIIIGVLLSSLMWWSHTG
jgi:hypothetical protein